MKKVGEKGASEEKKNDNVGAEKDKWERFREVSRKKKWKRRRDWEGYREWEIKVREEKNMKR